MGKSASKQADRNEVKSYNEFSVGKNRRLCYSSMKARLSPVRGTVIFLQDWGRPIKNCHNVTKALAERGFYSTSFDWFDIGYSVAGRQNRPIHPLEHFRFDPEKLNIFLQDVVLPDFPAPFFVLAQGVGGLFALTAHNWLLNQIRRMVIISPQLEVRGWQANGLYHYYLHFLVTLGLEGGRWHRSAAIDEVLSEESSHLTIDLNPHWSKSILDSVARITSPAYCEQMAVPTLFVTSNRDSRSDPYKTRKLANQLRFAQSVCIPGASPDMLDDSAFYSNRFWSAFDAFIPGTGAPVQGHLLEDSVIL